MGAKPKALNQVEASAVSAAREQFQDAMIELTDKEKVVDAHASHTPHFPPLRLCLSLSRTSECHDFQPSLSKTCTRSLLTLY